MWKLALLIVLMIAPVTYGQDDYAKHLWRGHDIPGSTITVYGGPYKIAYREINRFLINEWDAWSETLYLSGEITSFRRDQRAWKIRDDVQLLKEGGGWWQREHWWNSYPADKGGAPSIPRIRHIGHTYTLFDFKAFYFTNVGELRWRALKATIDLKDDEDTFSLGHKRNWSGLGWKIGIKPRLKFTTRGRALNKAFRSIGLIITLSHYVRKVRIVNAQIQARYNPPKHEGELLFYLSLAQW